MVSHLTREASRGLPVGYSFPDERVPDKLGEIPFQAHDDFNEVDPGETWRSSTALPEGAGGRSGQMPAASLAITRASVKRVTVKGSRDRDSGNRRRLAVANETYIEIVMTLFGKTSRWGCTWGRKARNPAAT